MPEVRLDVYLLGETQLSTSPAKLAQNLAVIFKKDSSIFEKMLSQPRSLLKANVDSDIANKFKRAIDKAGGCCELVTRSAPSSASAAQRATQPFVVTPIPAEPVAASLTMAGDDPKWPASDARTTATDEDEMMTDEHKPAPKSLIRLLIAGAAGLVIVLAVIVATLSPAYLESKASTAVQAALPLINQTRQTVTAAIQQKNFLPSENILAGLPDDISNEFVSSIKLGKGAQLIVNFRIPHLMWSEKHTIIWTPTKNGDDVVWQCLGGTMRDRYRMPECRGGSGAAK